eukprot:CAMPEP_0174303948 /NCGR_PEP_ID=MMETSP0809-20121228/60488_1 /TAXON_ID=73025 ORGANISM="Eutreptiella gymnastica-like, Strain CCMP1594" /NCGR_SAMPLE_ID=MMETSP0809 /ASSEMBLY_ACC=CAM_ASM_000658 /LENGTH=42 /DNA_ID= /DNA_START= /DNA_END= /DNA_ORIENTATION=
MRCIEGHALVAAPNDAAPYSGAHTNWGGKAKTEHWTICGSAV